MKPLLLARAPHMARALPLGRRAGDVEAQLVPALPAPDALDLDRPIVVLLDRTTVAPLPDAAERLRALADVAALVWCGSAGEEAPGPDVPVELLTTFLPGGAPRATAATLLQGALRHAVTLRAERLARRLADERLTEIAELARVGAALGTERDLLALLRLVLMQARLLTASDAGSLYLVESVAEGAPAADAPCPGAERWLRFKLAQNDTLPDVPLAEFTLAIDDASLAGHAAAADELLVIPDVYALPPDAPYRVNSSFDDRIGYRTKSVLVVPLKTHKGDNIGVLQLINRKRTPQARLDSREAVEREVLPYDRRCIEHVTALAAQAAVAIENSRLYESIERLFEGFVTASVTAIESRDPTTSGHSARVAVLTVELAESLERGGIGAWRGTRFTREELRELRYAALLHDFGKVGVREEVLVKSEKLYPQQLERIRHRIERLRCAEDVRFERARADHLLAHGRTGYDEVLAELGARRDAARAHLDRLQRAVEAANAPGETPSHALAELIALDSARSGGARLLQEDELRALRVPRGTLADYERREIEAHVTHTFRFLSQIPWTRELRNVAEIAYGHHEKLNGLGYPRGLTAPQLPVQVRMMTIADIFDALTATDRPYRRALPPERALDILRREADAGELDRDLLTTFIESQTWRASGGMR
ncbi:MAG TPA: HD domain-containing phosphohydrolase [Gemmatimonadaceae bacterium]|nr:HD domain-containing phosphohydrolase [Gemmatimonadaceae bacterium]